MAQEDMENVIFGNGNTVNDRHLQLKVQIEEKKFYYRVERRPLSWFWCIFSFIFLALVLSGLASYLFGEISFVSGWGGFISFACVIIIIVMIVYFCLDYDEHGFKGFQRIRNLISLKRDIDMLQTELRLLEDFQKTSRPLQEQYAEEIAQVVQQYTHGANYYRRFYYTLQIFIIFCSLLVTGLTSGLTNLVTIFNRPWIAPALSFAVSFLTAIITLFRFRERGHNLQQTADAVQYEISSAMKGIFGYKNLPEKDAYIKLAEEVERLINEQRKRQQQLEQASEIKQSTE